MYEIILPQVSYLLRNITNQSDIFASTYYVDYPRRAIFFEDLSLKGFRNADRCNGLDIIHTKIVLRNMAKFHAACAELKRQKPSIFDNFKYGEYLHIYNNINIDFMKY